uniref:SID1 transmembrane family member 1 n=1 Tax=Chelydra serpentina TaxID=8475 RepID=A0A8C3XM17_CHESE
MGNHRSEGRSVIYGLAAWGWRESGLGLLGSVLRSWLMCLTLSLPSLSAVFGLVYRPRDFASYMLGIFICNLLLYLAFYIIMKLRSSEKLLPIPLFCIVATAVVWAAALYFFFQNLSSWEVKTPAESREKNRPCVLLGFFDDHDVWHFLSAAALFFSFLVTHHTVRRSSQFCFLPSCAVPSAALLAFDFLVRWLFLGL